MFKVFINDILFIEKYVAVYIYIPNDNCPMPYKDTQELRLMNDYVNLVIVMP